MAAPQSRICYSCLILSAISSFCAGSSFAFLIPAVSKLKLEPNGSNIFVCVMYSVVFLVLLVAALRFYLTGAGIRPHGKPVL